MLTCTVAHPSFASTSGRAITPCVAGGHRPRTSREWRIGRSPAESHRKALRVRITSPVLQCGVRKHGGLLVPLPPTRAVSSEDGETHAEGPPPHAKKAKSGADVTRSSKGGASAGSQQGSKPPAVDLPRAVQGQGQGQGAPKAGGRGTPRTGGAPASGPRPGSNANGHTNGKANPSVKSNNNNSGNRPVRDKDAGAAAAAAAASKGNNGAAATASKTAATAQAAVGKAEEKAPKVVAATLSSPGEPAAAAPQPTVATAGSSPPPLSSLSPSPSPSPSGAAAREELLRHWDEEDRAMAIGALAGPAAQGARKASGGHDKRPSASAKGGAPPSSSAAPQEASCMFAGSRGQALIRRLALLKNSGQVLEALEEWAASPEGRAAGRDCGSGLPEFNSGDALVLMRGVLAAGNVDLALSIFHAMKAAGASKGYDPAAARSASPSPPASQLQPAVWRWPLPDLPLHEALVQGLAANCRVADAITVVNSLRRRGAMGGAEVHFGRVVSCPNPTCGKPLAVVQPQQGIQRAPCSCCQYEYELVSGKVVASTSEAINVDETLLQKLVKLITKRTGVKAVHNIKIQTPDGQARTFRFGTASASVPALESERVTLAAAASDIAKGAQFGRPARLPGTSPSEPLVATNHTSGAVTRLMPPPPTPGAVAGFPSAVLQRAVVVVPLAAAVLGTDALNAFIDPTIPRAVAAGTLLLAAAGVVGNSVVLPQMNKLLPGTVGRYVIRQSLLEKHDALEARLKDLTDAIAEEIRMVARLFQLQTKMEAVGQQGVYSARIERVRAARAGLEERMVAKLELVDKYATIANMIEIEVEMDSDLATAELKGAAEGISEEIQKVMEVESLQKEWMAQSEAMDEVERLLRSENV